jgi:hypothetical protein
VGLVDGVHLPLTAVLVDRDQQGECSPASTLYRMLSENPNSMKVLDDDYILWVLFSSVDPVIRPAILSRTFVLTISSYPTAPLLIECLSHRRTLQHTSYIQARDAAAVDELLKSFGGSFQRSSEHIHSESQSQRERERDLPAPVTVRSINPIDRQ